MILLTGCSSNNFNYYPEEKFINYGEPGEIKTVLAGDSILHTQKEVLTDALEVTKHIDEFNIIIPKGIYLKSGEDKNNIYFYPVSMEGRPVLVNKSSQYILSIAYKKSTNKFYPDIDGGFALISFSDGKIIKNLRTKKMDNDFLYKSLDYGGSKGQYVSFVYREGSNQQRMTVDTKQSKIFSYDGAKIEILKFNQDTLTCKIISHFDLFD